MLWPRRGHSELRQRFWSFFDGSCKSRTTRTRYASCNNPGVSTPVWFGGENRSGLQDPEAVQRGALKGGSTSPWPTAASSSRTSPSEQPEPAAEEDREDLRCRLPERRLRGPRGGFSIPVYFPHHAVDFDQSHPLTVMPTAGGNASAAPAKPQIGAARGAAES